MPAAEVPSSEEYRIPDDLEKDQRNGRIASGMQEDRDENAPLGIVEDPRPDDPANYSKENQPPH